MALRDYFFLPLPANLELLQNKMFFKKVINVFNHM